VMYFTANGREAEQDPYYIDDYVVNFDGTGLRRLSSGVGMHTVQFSPDYKFYVDRVAPLRVRADSAARGMRVP